MLTIIAVITQMTSPFIDVAEKLAVRSHRFSACVVDGGGCSPCRDRPL